LRELMEETGVTATLHSHIETIDTVFDAKPYRLFDYACLWVAGEPVAADDADDARWFTLAEARTLGMWPKTLEVVELAVKATRRPADPALDSPP
jgi:8-oxo-dGTP diphosphatase